MPELSDSLPDRYEFLAPRKIIFGWGRWREAGPAAAACGNRAFIVMGSRTLVSAGFHDRLREVLADSHVQTVELLQIDHEPQVDDVDRAAEQVRGHGIRAGDMVVAVGGGSAIDLAKALAALATNTAGSSVRDYLEGVGRGLQLERLPLPIVALPTTAGTGSEATKNAVISSYDPAFKKSLRSEGLIPSVVVIDPELTASTPPTVTAHCGMDAITQLIESYISQRACPLPRALVLEGLPLAVGSIVDAVENGRSQQAREAMAHAALLSGMALANSGLGMAHGVAAALGTHFRVPHGLACAVMLPVALCVNKDCCQRQLAELAVACGLAEPRESHENAAAKLIERIDQICQRIGVCRRLGEFGVRPEHVSVLARDSRGNSMDGNPRDLSDDELRRVLAAEL